LVHVAHTLRRILGDDGCLICRFGGDEFVVLFDNAPPQETLNTLAGRVIDALKVPFIFEGQPIPISVSIGSANGDNKETVFSRADIALYAAKNAGRACYRAYSHRNDLSTKVRMRRRQDLLDALQEDRIECWYQPQFDARSHEMIGAEALARMQLSDGTVIAPDDFLPLAEQSGYLRQIEELIFQKVLSDQDAWCHAGLMYPTVAVNLSQGRLSDANLVTGVAKALKPRHAISVELLETALLDRPDAVELSSIAGLRELGLAIELDDFGSGHASIVALMSVQPDRIKIDRRVTEEIDTSSKALNTLRAVTALGRAQGAEILLEGIETQSQLDAVQYIDCDYLQGFALAAPLRAMDFTNTLAHVPRKQGNAP
jgi:predicted signal transduction protein with EAL and GGDEF domain